jgi:hypothetical protein
MSRSCAASHLPPSCGVGTQPVARLSRFHGALVARHPPPSCCIGLLADRGLQPSQHGQPLVPAARGRRAHPGRAAHQRRAPRTRAMDPARDRPSHGVQDQPVAVRHHSAGVSYYLQSDDQGIRRVATRTDIDNEPTADTEPLWVLKAPYQVGTEWTTPTVPYLIQRKNEHPRDLKYTHKALMTWRIEAVDDSVTLADGSAIQTLPARGRRSPPEPLHRPGERLHRRAPDQPRVVLPGSRAGEAGARRKSAQRVFDRGRAAGGVGRFG